MIALFLPLQFFKKAQNTPLCTHTRERKNCFRQKKPKTILTHFKSISKQGRDVKCFLEIFLILLKKQDFSRIFPPKALWMVVSSGILSLKMFTKHLQLKCKFTNCLQIKRGFFGGAAPAPRSLLEGIGRLHKMSPDILGKYTEAFPPLPLYFFGHL